MWCTNCGAELADGVKFCTSCGNKIEVPEESAGGNANKNNTFVLSATKAEQKNDITSQVHIAPQVPVYGPADYIENKTAKAEKGKAGYIVILIICVLVILVSMGLVLWTVFGDSIGSKNDDTDIEEFDDDDEEDDEEDEEEEEEDEDGEGENEPSDDEPSQSQTTIIGTGTAIQEPETPVTEEEPAQEEPEEIEEESQYLLEDSDKRYISEEELYDFDEWECRLARNELYARHGRIFDTPEVQEYFEEKDWYYGTVGSDEWNSGKGDNKYFNDYEIANRDLIVKYEKEMGWR